MIVALLVLLNVIPFAQAQPTLFIPPVRTADPSLIELARVVDVEVEAQLSQYFRVLTIDSVPAYQDYGADVYLDACPPNEDIGCTYVLANRISAPIALSFRLSRVDNAKMLVVTILDVVSAKKAIAFTMNLTGENTGTAVNVVVRALEAFDVQGPTDLRTQTQTQKRAIQEGRAEHVAEVLALLGEGVSLNENQRSEITSPKFTADDLASWLQTDAVTPWEQVGLSQRQYVRYKNAKTTLDRWKKRARGTQGSLVFESSFGFIYGPYDQNFSASYLLNPTKNGFTVQRVEQSSGVTQAMAGQASISVGFGVHPTTEILGTLFSNTGRYQYLEQKEVVGDKTTFPAQPESRSKSSGAIGVQLNFTPLPDLIVKPTITTAVKYQRGTDVEAVWEVADEIDPIKAPSFWMISVEPGASAALTSSFSLFIRGQFGLAVGALYNQTQAGGGDLSLPVEIITPNRTSFGLILGASKQIGPLFKHRNYE